MAIRPYQAMWKALGRHFHDPRLQQLFGRYATYCGSSPFVAPEAVIGMAVYSARAVLQGKGRDVWQMVTENV